MEKRPGIYKITNTLNGKMYIGQSKDVKKRVDDHKANLRRGCNTNIHLQRAYNKYGKDAFEYSVIEYCDESDLNNREIYWISEYKANKVGYNMTPGGSGIRDCAITEETIEKLRNKPKKFWEEDSMCEKDWRNYVTEEAYKEHSKKPRDNMLSNPTVVRRAVCINDGRHFESMVEAGIFYDITVGMILHSCQTLSCCYGAKDKNGFPLLFLYEEDYYNKSRKELDESLYSAINKKKDGRKKTQKQVVNLITNEIFDSLVDAGKKYGIKPNKISMNASGRSAHAGELNDGTILVWMYYDEYIDASEEDIQRCINRHVDYKKEQKLKLAKPVVCLETSQVYESVTDAARICGLDASSIVKCCKGKNKSCGKLDGTPLTWRYFKESST